MKRSEKWRLSSSALWLPDEMILKIVELLLHRVESLTERLAVARLSSVCKAWDGALLPLFHPGVPGVISPTELRKLKRLALDQTNYSPLSDLPHPSTLESSFAHIQANDRRSGSRKAPPPRAPTRPGFLLPERMLLLTDYSKHNTSLTHAFTSAVMSKLNEAVVNQYGLHLYRHLICLLTTWFTPQRRLDLLLQALYEESVDVYHLLHFSRSACLAYRILMVIKAVEARAMALDEAPDVKDSLPRHSQDPAAHRLLGSTRAHRVPIAVWRTNSPPGMLAGLAWEVHRESSESYNRMARALVGGSRATRLPTPLGTGSGVSAPPSTEGAEGLWIQRKARELFPLHFLAAPANVCWPCPISNPITGPPPAESGFCSGFRAALGWSPAPICDVEVALVAGMSELLGRVPGDDTDDDEEEGEDLLSYSGGSLIDSDLYSDFYSESYDSDLYSAYGSDYYGSYDEDDEGLLVQL